MQNHTLQDDDVLFIHNISQWTHLSVDACLQSRISGKIFRYLWFMYFYPFYLSHFASLTLIWYYILNRYLLFQLQFKKSLAGSRVCLVCFSRFLVIWACKFHCLQDCVTFSFDGTQTVVVALGKTQTNNNQNFRACTNNS